MISRFATIKVYRSKAGCCFPAFLLARFSTTTSINPRPIVSRGAGVKLRPSIVADLDAGIHHTTVFANGDFNIYPDKSDANTVNAQAGFSHKWEAMRDLIFQVGGDYEVTRTSITNGVVTTPFATVGGVIASPERYNVFGGYVSGLKSFDPFFVGLSASSYGTTYDTLYTDNGSAGPGLPG